MMPMIMPTMAPAISPANHKTMNMATNQPLLYPLLFTMELIFWDSQIMRMISNMGVTFLPDDSHRITGKPIGPANVRRRLMRPKGACLANVLNEARARVMNSNLAARCPGADDVVNNDQSSFGTAPT